MSIIDPLKLLLILSDTSLNIFSGDFISKFSFILKLSILYFPTLHLNNHISLFNLNAAPFIACHLVYGFIHASIDVNIVYKTYVNNNIYFTGIFSYFEKLGKIAIINVNIINT